MQKLTNKIKVIDNNNEKKFMEKIHKEPVTTIFESNYCFKKMEDSSHSAISEAGSMKSLQDNGCSECRRK